MRVKITKLQNESIVAMDGINLLQVNKLYDFEIIGYCLIHNGCYELKYINGDAPNGIAYPCACAEDENYEKYLICVEGRKRYSLFKNINKGRL